jgi:hypothetical protein
MRKADATCANIPNFSRAVVHCTVSGQVESVAQLVRSNLACLGEVDSTAGRIGARAIS